MSFVFSTKVAGSGDAFRSFRSRKSPVVAHPPFPRSSFRVFGFLHPLLRLSRSTIWCFLRPHGDFRLTVRGRRGHDKTNGLDDILGASHFTES